MENELKEYVCVCGRKFNNSQGFNGHRSHCEKYLGDEKYQESVRRRNEALKKAAEGVRQKSESFHQSKMNDLLKWESEGHICERCGKIMTQKFASGRFCSTICAHRREQSNESKLKTARSLRTFYASLSQSETNPDDCLNFDKYVPEAKTLYLDGIITSKTLKYYIINKIESIDFVVCPYCNLRMSCVNAQHLKKHNKTLQDLKNDFGDTYETISQVSHSTRSQIGTKTQQRLVEEGKHIGWTTRNIRSYAELFWEKVLKNNKFQYEPEYVLKKTDIGINEKGCYFLDFLIDGHIDLEIDGKQHQYDERKEHDMLRDERLKTNGFTIYRIPWVNPVESERVKKQIDDFIEWYNLLIKDRC